MILKLNQTLICKRSIVVGHHGIIENEKYTISLIKNDSVDESLFDFDNYIMVDGFLGYAFYITDNKKFKKSYIWNNFYHPNEIRKIKLKKLSNDII